MPSTGRTVRVVVRPRRLGRWVGWWPAGLVAGLVVLCVLAVPSLPVTDGVVGSADGSLADGPVAGQPGRRGDGADGGEGTDGAAGSGSAEGSPVDGATGPGATGGGPAGPGAPSEGDRSHCTPDGRQHAVIFHAPPCVPVFTGDNGGATAPGVTATTIRVVAFMLQCEQTTELLLQSLGFATVTCAQTEAMMRATVAHLNKRLELYGRRVELSFKFADCPFPEDLDTCLADAREVIASRPFAVVTTFAGTYQAVWQEFARRGVVIIGGGSLGVRQYLEHSPYWWSREMSSTLQAELVADWWCATMARRSATHTGAVIHPSVGKRGEVTRRAGFLYYDAPAGRQAAEILDRRLRACGTELTSFGYAADIASIQQQSLAATSRFIADGVTTVMWFDFLAPTFAISELTRQNYFPEHVIAGGGSSNDDSGHRTIDRRQWSHAFGIVPESTATPRDATDGTAVLRDGGFRGAIPPYPDSATQGLLQLGNLLQAAGPFLTPEALRAIEAEPRRGGDGTGDATGPREGIGFGPSDHNGVDDVREVYWDPRAKSPLDGLPGASMNTDGAARRTLGGAWAGPDAVPVRP